MKWPIGTPPFYRMASKSKKKVVNCHDDKTKTKEKYDREFKKKTVELSIARGNAREVAEELDIRPELLYRWRREYDRFETNSFSGNGKLKMTDLERENAHLQKKLRQAKMEREETYFYFFMNHPFYLVTQNAMKILLWQDP